VVFNGAVVEEDGDIASDEVAAALKAGLGRLEVIILQAKLHGAGTTAIEKLMANLPRLMSLSAGAFDESEFNDKVLSTFEVARAMWRKVAASACELNMHVYVATLSDIEPVSAETEAKRRQLVGELEHSLAGVSSAEVTLMSAREIVRRHRTRARQDFTLPYHKCLPASLDTWPSCVLEITRSSCRTRVAEFVKRSWRTMFVDLKETWR
jgi:hypothetical protein